MTIDSKIGDREGERNRKHTRGNVLITSATAILTALLTLAGTLVGVYFSPKDVQQRLAPNAGVTVAAPAVTVTSTATSTVTAAPPETGSPGLVSGPPVYLTDLADAITADNADSTSGAVNIDGTAYLHSVAIQISSSNNTEWLEYTLTAPYKSFTATLGLNDEVATDSAAQFVISGNGRVLYKRTVKYTQRVKATVDLTGLVKLRIAATRVAGDPRWEPRGAVFGDATLHQ